MSLRAAARPGRFADINVTPLVDVMLVLLASFMVAAPLLEQGIQVNLPKAVTSEVVSGPDLSITLTKDHVIYFGDAVVTLKELRKELSGLQQQPIIIKADRSAYVSRLVDLWDLCRDAGFREVHIITMME